MKSNNHYIWEEYKKSNAYSVALSWADQLKEYAKQAGNDHRGIRIVNKRNLTLSNQRHADCQIVWSTGPDNWAYHLPINTHNVNNSVCVEAHTGNSLSFYTV